MPQSKGSSLLVRLIISLLMISFLPSIAIAQTKPVKPTQINQTKTTDVDDVDDAEETTDDQEIEDGEGNVTRRDGKPIVETSEPPIDPAKVRRLRDIPRNSSVVPSKPKSLKPTAKPPINDGVFPSTESDPDAIDPKELSERSDKEADFELLKGELPCLDSSSSCIKLLTERAITNSPSLKGLNQQIELNEANVKAVAESGRGNIFSQIQPFVPFLAVPSAPLALGAAIASVIGNLSSNTRSDTANAQGNANLQIQIAQIERTKVEVQERLQDNVLESLIVFDNLRIKADIAVAIANRESSRFKLIEIGYRLGEGDTNSFISLQNGLDRTRLGVTESKAAMRSQAAKIKRIVLGDEA